MPEPSWAAVMILFICAGVMIALTVLGFDPEQAALYALLAGWVAAEIVRQFTRGGPPPASGTP